MITKAELSTFQELLGLIDDAKDCVTKIGATPQEIEEIQRLRRAAEKLQREYMCRESV